MQFQNTWNTSFDQRFKAESLIDNNVEILERSATADRPRQNNPRKIGGSRMFQLQQLIRIITENRYNVLSQLFTWKSLQALPNISLKKYRQSIYYGQFPNNSRQGQGIMLYTNGRVYEGSWGNNYKHGKGFEKFQTNAVYEGDYVNGMPHGYGRYSWPNGEYYEGEWTQGMKNGSGIWRGPSGDSYIGEWKDGQANGYGVHTWVNGDRYQGQFENCLKHGEGIEKFSNGDSYKGTYYQGKPQGVGEYYWAMGSFFKGTFKNGLREGHGLWKSGPGNSDKYEGEYKADKKEGYGIFMWANGNIYKGNYANDLREGYGQMIWNDGRCYKGEWREGMQCSHVQDEMNFPGFQQAYHNQPYPSHADQQDDDEDECFVESTRVNNNINSGFNLNSERNNKSHPRWDVKHSNISLHRNMLAQKKRHCKNQNYHSTYNSAYNSGNQAYDNNFTQQGCNNQQAFFEQKPFLNSKKSSKNSPYLLNNKNKWNFYNSPDHPTVIPQDQRRFRSRGCMLKKTDSSQQNQNRSRNHKSDKQFTRSNPHKNFSVNSYKDNNFMDESIGSPRRIKTKRRASKQTQQGSIRLRNNASSDCYMKKNIRSDSNANNRNASQKMMMSSSFFLYKIHGKSTPQQANNMRNRRAVKTSGGMRQKRLPEDGYYMGNEF